MIILEECNYKTKNEYFKDHIIKTSSDYLRRLQVQNF